VAVPERAQTRGPEREASAQVSNIKTIAQLEAQELERRSRMERLGDRLVLLLGNWGFAFLHLVCFAAWICINLGLVPGVPIFDPYPFNFLTMSVSLEAIFITIAVLNSQNRMARQSDRRAQLDLQINLLAEQESTATLRLLQGIAGRLGVPLGDPAPAELAEQTNVEDLVEKLDQKLPTPDA
jgi:uncharacterized membrane protein